MLRADSFALQESDPNMRIDVQILNQQETEYKYALESIIDCILIVENKELHYVGIETMLLQTVAQIVVISLHCWNFELKPMNVLNRSWINALVMLSTLQR